MGILWLTQTPLAGLRRQEKQKLHLGSNASESSYPVTCQSQCSLEIVKWSNKHVLDRRTHKILAQKYLTDFFQLFKATLLREWKNKTGCPTFLVLLESIQRRAAFVTVSHTKGQSHFPGLPHFCYTYKAEQGWGMKTRHSWGSLGMTQEQVLNLTTGFPFQTPFTHWLCLILQKCFPTILPPKFPNTSI